MDVQQEQQEQEQQQQQPGSVSILSLPTEVIAQICSYSVLNPADLFNLGVSHSTLNNRLFHEQNSALWKTKYIQKYGCDWTTNEVEITINERNTWKDEIMARMRLFKAVPCRVVQLPAEHMKFKNVPHHAYPFAEELYSVYQSRQYYVLIAIYNFYDWQSNRNREGSNIHIFHTSHRFLTYVNQVYFSYKIKKYLSLPPSEQTIERAFHLAVRWWSPTNYSSFYDLKNHLDITALLICDVLHKANRTHPMFVNGYDFGVVVRNGRTNLDHDLFNETNTMIILNCINDYIFCNNDDMRCHCDTHTINCYSLQWALDYEVGTLLILSVLYESITRRFGVKVNLTATPNDTIISWTSSWPGNRHKNNTCYLIDITNGGRIRQATVSSERYAGTPVSDLLRQFSATVEEFSINDLITYKYVHDFQKLIRPDDIRVESRCKNFHRSYDFCPCPLIRTSLNPSAPKHKDRKFNLQPGWKDIFPLVPKRRGTDTNPKYSIGMLVDVTKSSGLRSKKVTKRAVIVGWSKVPNNNTILYYVYYVYNTVSYLDDIYTAPVIDAVLENKKNKFRRRHGVCPSTYSDVSRLFKSFSQELRAFEPIDELAERYPDDHTHTVNSTT